MTVPKFNRSNSFLKQTNTLNILLIIVNVLLLLDFLTRLYGNIHDRTSSGNGSVSGISIISSEAEAEAEDGPDMWSPEQIVSYMTAYPQRSYFAHLFAYGGFRRGIEIGVQDGRYSEVLLDQNARLLKKDRWSLVLVDPHPTKYLKERLGIEGKHMDNKPGGGVWEQEGYLKNVDVTFERTTAMDPQLLQKYPDGYFDFVYLDGLHEHEEVRAEIPIWWHKVRSGGVLAGHDYCNYGEEGLSCNGCKQVPECRPYTLYGVDSAGPKEGRSSNQNGVVMAVQEWMVEESGDPTLEVHHTLEDYTRKSLAKDGFEFYQVIARDRNPSWFIVKP